MVKRKQAEKKISKQPPSRVEQAVQVGSRIELSLFRLIESSSKLDPSKLQPPWKLSNHINTQVGVDINDSTNIIVLLDCSLQVSGNEKDESQSLEESPLFCKATFQAVFKRTGDAEFTKEQLGDFGRSTGIVVAWPYWREFVQTMTSRMGLPPLVLPLFHVPITKADTKAP